MYVLFFQNIFGLFFFSPSFSFSLKRKFQVRRERGALDCFADERREGGGGEGGASRRGGDNDEEKKEDEEGEV